MNHCATSSVETSIPSLDRRVFGPRTVVSGGPITAIERQRFRVSGVVGPFRRYVAALVVHKGATTWGAYSPVTWQDDSYEDGNSTKGTEDKERGTHRPSAD